MSVIVTNETHKRLRYSHGVELIRETEGVGGFGMRQYRIAGGRVLEIPLHDLRVPEAETRKHAEDIDREWRARQGLGEGQP